MNSADPSGNFISRRNDGGGRGGRGEDYFERFHINQFYNAVEDEQIYMDEYTTLVHRYNDFIVNGTAIFSRMEQTLRENLSRTVVRQSFYYNRFAELRDAPRRVRGNESRPSPIPLSRVPASAATTPVREPRYGDVFSRLLSSSMDEINILPMLYTVPLGTRTTDRIPPLASVPVPVPVPAAGPPTNDQITRATLNTVFANILSPVNATCPISRDEFNDESEITMIRGCCHIFNRASLREWFATHSTCPMCRGDIRMYRVPVAAAAATPPAAPLHRTNMSIDSIDENHITFSYDLPTHVSDNQIYRDIVNTISVMTAAPATQQPQPQPQPQPPSRRMDDNYYNYDDDDIMEVD